MNMNLRRWIRGYCAELESGGGGRYVQDTLYIHIKYSKNKKVNK